MKTISGRVLDLINMAKRPMTAKDMAYELFGENAQHRVSQAIENLRKKGCIIAVQNTYPKAYVKPSNKSTGVIVKKSEMNLECDFTQCHTSEHVRDVAKAALKRMEKNGFDLNALNEQCKKKFVSSEYKSALNVRITPLEAAWALAYGWGGNRAFNLHNARKLVKEIKSGNWNLVDGKPVSGSPIVVTPEGFHTEGQHRLVAIVETGEALKFTLNTGSTEGTIVGALVERIRKPEDQLIMSLRKAGYSDKVNEEDQETYRDIASRLCATPGSRITGSKFTGVDADKFTAYPSKVDQMFLCLDFKEKMWAELPELELHSKGANRRILVSALVDMTRATNAASAAKVFNIVFGNDTPTLGTTGVSARLILTKLLGAKDAKRELRENAILGIFIDLARIVAKPYVPKIDKGYGQGNAFFRKHVSTLKHLL